MFSNRQPFLNTLQTKAPQRFSIIFSIVFEHDFVIAAPNATQKWEWSSDKKKTSNVEFLSKFKTPVNILEPTDQLIVKYRLNNVLFLDLSRNIHQLPAWFAAIACISMNAAEELQYLVLLSSQRLRFLYIDAHCLAYTMSSRYLGEGLSQAHLCKLDYVPLNLPLSSNPNSEERKSNRKQMVAHGAICKIWQFNFFLHGSVKRFVWTELFYTWLCSFKAS